MPLETENPQDKKENSQKPPNPCPRRPETTSAASYNGATSQIFKSPILIKGSFNKGTYGDTEPPWSLLQVDLHKPLVSTYGIDYSKPKINYNNKNNKEINPEMIKKLKQENEEYAQRLRDSRKSQREIIFQKDKEKFDNYMKNEEEKWQRAQEAYDKCESLVYNYKGIAKRSTVTPLQQCEGRLNNIQESERRIREMVPSLGTRN
eukprot:Tbor_TRINITY_DN5801_c4_g4::TRINITY_DN5801_c4_g4_i1::g.6591::m.6591